MRRRPSAGKALKGRKTKTTTAIRDAMQRVVQAISHIRGGKSLTRAARLSHTSASTVLKYAGGALKKADRVYVAEPFDTLPRRVMLLTPSGKTIGTVSGSRASSRVATYMSAVEHYLRMGDASRLRVFAGKGFRADGKRMPFVTDLSTLRRLHYAGEISYEDFYPETA